MSQLIDYMLKGESDMDLNINMDINNMDFHLDSGDMMTSEFFDSVMSMEKENFLDAIDDTSIRFFNNDLLKDDDGISFADSSSDQSTLHNSPTTDSGSMDSDNFHEQITLFGNKTSETLTSDDYYSLLDESVNDIQETHHLQEFIEETHAPIVTNIHTTPKIVKRVPASSNSPKKVIVTKPVPQTNISINNANKKVFHPGKNQVIRVQAGGRSLLLPVNVKDIKKLKVIRANDFNMETIKLIPAQAKPVFKKITQYAASTSSESVDDDIDIDHHVNVIDGTYPALELTGEEKRLLMKEGIKLPTHYPLTKYEEKELKRIRRKIRNKISAQDSRKRKKEYVDQLEEKARKTDEENELLKNKVKNLNRENTRLSEQLKKLQELLCSSSSKATPTTCLMIVLFSTLLVCLPNLRTSDNKEMEVGEQQIMAARRALLFNPTKDEEEQVNMEEFLVFNKEEAETRFDEEDKDNGTNAFVKYLGDLSKKYETIIRSNCTEILQGGSLQDFCKRHQDEFKQALQDLRLYLDRNKPEEKKFIEPDISDDEDFGSSIKERSAYLLDDDDPPTKKIRISSEHLEYESNAVGKFGVSSSIETSSLPLKRE